MEDMALNPPDSIIKVSDPAKQSFDEVAEPEPDTEAVAPAGAALGDGTDGAAIGDGTDGAAIGDATDGAAIGDGTDGAALGVAEGIGTEDVEGTLASPVK
jgi:hypothetical protein